MSTVNTIDNTTDEVPDRESVLACSAKVIPNGTSAAGRAEPRDVIVRARGTHPWNAQGKRYVDYLLSWGRSWSGTAIPGSTRPSPVPRPPAT